MIEPTRKIDLKVPTSWDQCSTPQLELIARTLLRHTARQDRYHPFDPVKFKTECFFALTGLTILSSRLSEASLLSSRLSEAHGEISGDSSTTLGMTVKLKRGEPFRLEVWQVYSFVEQHLKWLDDFTGLRMFPYPQPGHYWQADWHLPLIHRRRLEGPAPLLDGMTWRQFRFAGEWLSVYTQGESSEAREGFLKALFGVIDMERTPRALRRMRPDQFQLILIWWQSMMAEMQRKYRRCFTTSGKKGARQGNPVDLYTRSTATLQDKYHLTEDDINRQPCRVILQHLEDMAHEAEEMERISRQSKRK